MNERALDKFLNKKAGGALARPGDAAEVDYKAYGINRDGRPALMLELRCAPGFNLALSYPYLMSVSLDATGTLTLLFTSHRVRVTGRNLRRVYDALLSHTLRYLQEGDDPEGAGGEGDAFIGEISIEEMV